MSAQPRTTALMFKLQYQKQVLLMHACMMSTIPSLQRHSWSSPTIRQQSPQKRICLWCFLIYFMCWVSNLYTFCSSSHQLPPLNSYWINRTAASKCITCPLTSAHTLTWWNEEQFRCFLFIFFTTKEQSKRSHLYWLNTASIKMQIGGCLQLELPLRTTAALFY